MRRRKSIEPTLKMSENAERDIWEGAGIMIERHGDMAVIEASKVADHYLEIGDIDMQRAWLRVVRAIVDMSNTDKMYIN